MLHGMRKRMQAMAEAEAAGQSYWTEVFDLRVRTRVLLMYERLARENGFDRDGRIFETARQSILEQMGLRHLGWDGAGGYNDFRKSMESGPHDMYPTLIESLILALDLYEKSLGFAFTTLPAKFAAGTNEIFSQERVAWKLVNGEMVEMRSTELHEAVVEPALRLIHSERFAKVDETYRKALDELSKGDGPDAVTDAGTALQELLTALGCDGNQLGDLVRSARKKGLLGAHDTPLLDAVEKAMHWVAADRSEAGESHHTSSATREDAWLIVHVVGAFIVRLAAGGNRPQR